MAYASRVPCETNARCAQSLTEGEILAREFGELDHQVIRRDFGTSDDPRIQLLEQGEPGFFRPAGDKRDFKQNEVVGVVHPEKRRRVQEAFAWKHMDDLEKVIRRTFRMLMSAS